METPERSGRLTTYFAVYVCLLAISALQILIAYRSLEGLQTAVHAALAVVQAILMITFFMHMKSEQCNFGVFPVARNCLRPCYDEL